MKLSQVEFLTSVADLNRLPRMPMPTIAFAGRSNVGKSSLINALLNRKNIAKTSSSPGKTRHINYFSVNNKMYIADLPGYGFAKVSRQERDRWKALIEPFLADNNDLRIVFILVDIRHGLKESDIQLIDFLDHHERKVQVILTKHDKLSRSQADKQRNTIVREYNLHNEPIMFSSPKKTGVREVWGAVLKKGGIQL